LPPQLSLARNVDFWVTKSGSLSLPFEIESGRSYYFNFTRHSHAWGKKIMFDEISYCLHWLLRGD
jgi:hypothetical protein